MMSRFVSTAAVTLMLAGCVATVQNTLSPSDVQAFKLADVRVSVPPQADIIGYDGIHEYAALKRVPNHELNAFTESEEAKSWMRDHLASRVKVAVQQNLAGALGGARPVRAEIVVRRFELSSAVQRVVIGGDYRLIADVTLVDAKSGAVIVAYPEMLHAVPALHGWGGAIVQAAYDAANPPGDRVVNGFAEKYRGWLLKT